MNFHFKTFVILVSLLTFLSGIPIEQDYLRYSVVGGDAAFIDSNEYDNGYPETKYHQVLDTFIRVYSPTIAKRGGTFHILRDFSDGAVNAWAWRLGNEFHLEVPGGMSRYYLISEEGFIMTICHELGHLLGGAPLKTQKKNISAEGQSDYFSTSKCIERMLLEITPYKKIKSDPEVISICKHNSSKYCQRAFSGMKSLTSYYAKLEGAKFPSLLNESTRVVRSTLSSTHPKAQCRLDTMKRGFLCPVNRDEDFSFDDPKVGACNLNHYPEFARPACWYKEGSL